MKYKMAIQRARRAIEQLYDRQADIYVQQQRLDERTKMTVSEEVCIFRDLPCRLSYKNTQSTAIAEELHDHSMQEVKLFLAPEIRIREGCRIVVRKTLQDGQEVLESYSASGSAALHDTHQEIPLKLWKDQL